MPIPFTLAVLPALVAAAYPASKAHAATCEPTGATPYLFTFPGNQTQPFAVRAGESQTIAGITLALSSDGTTLAIQGAQPGSRLDYNGNTYLLGGALSANTQSIPTLSEWGMIGMSGALAIGAAYAIKKREHQAKSAEAPANLSRRHFFKSSAAALAATALGAAGVSSGEATAATIEVPLINGTHTITGLTPCEAYVAPNTPPVPTFEGFTVSASLTMNHPGQLTASDADAGDALTYAISSQPSAGMINLDPATGSFT